MTSDDSSTSVVATSGHIVASVADEIVILHCTDNKYFGLNAVGRRIWELLSAPTTMAHIASVLAAEFEVDEAKAREDAEALVEELIESGLARRCSVHVSSSP
ncbi:MAG TPA: PqqD family protein [Polyangiaceae bacterium]